VARLHLVGSVLSVGRGYGHLGVLNLCMWLFACLFLPALGVPSLDTSKMVVGIRNGLGVVPSVRAF